MKSIMIKTKYLIMNLITKLHWVNKKQVFQFKIFNFFCHLE